MPDVPNSGRPRITAPESYEIRVTGRLAPRWTANFAGMTLTPHSDGTTVIHGPVADQSALHGLLRTLGDLGLTLLSVTPTATEPTRTRSTT